MDPKFKPLAQKIIEEILGRFKLEEIIDINEKIDNAMETIWAKELLERAMSPDYVLSEIDTKEVQMDYLYNVGKMLKSYIKYKTTKTDKNSGL